MIQPAFVKKGTKSIRSELIYLVRLGLPESVVVLDKRTGYSERAHDITLLVYMTQLSG